MRLGISDRSMNNDVCQRGDALHDDIIGNKLTARAQARQVPGLLVGQSHLHDLLP